MAMTQVDRDEIFLLFALTESGRALHAIDEIRRLAGLRQQRVPGVEVRENQSVFDQIRIALQFSANVSKVFWPQNSAAGRGERLRRLVGLPDSHALSSRKLRNHIEHLDERLDEWTEKSPRPFLTFEIVLHDDGRPPEVRDEVIHATAIVYEAASNTVLVFGQAFPLEELREGVEDVQRHTSKALAHDGK